MKRRFWLGALVLLAALSGVLVLPRAGAAPDVPANGMVVLLTDYGSADGYVGILKGAMLSANPAARLFDASHDVPNFDVAAASYLLGRIAPEWPKGTTFVVVIDPGVGTGRKMIAIETERDGKRYVAPDNGVLTDVLKPGEPVKVREITNQKLRRPGTVSATFHGRDWFGPVGARLAGGLPIEDVGPALGELVRLARVQPRREGAAMVGTLLYVDHYGNLLTNIGHQDLLAAGFREGQPLEIRVGEGNWTAVPWVGTYGDVARGALLLTTHNGQSGVEVAVNYGHAGERLGARAGLVVAVRPAAQG